MDNNILKISDYKLIIAMVGLPARGKSFTSNRLANYLNWCGLKCKVFNAGEFRRNILNGFQDNLFFDPNNIQAKYQREEICQICLKSLIDWLLKEGDIAIFDATNTTKERRKYIIEEVKKIDNFKIKVIFLELITDDSIIINRNLDLKMQSPDYIDKDYNFALEDFKRRIDLYQNIYQSIEDMENINYIRKFNLNNQISLRNINGACESLIISYLMNLKIINRPIYLSRHGESFYNTLGKLGGDSSLTEKGIDYASNLNLYLQKEIGQSEIVIFTSCLKRTIETSSKINLPSIKIIRSRLLNEIHAGICENMTDLEILKTMPEILEQRKANKLTYRYPEGESYLDLLERLQYFILQILSIDKPILIIAHRAINRILLGYFMGIKLEDIPYIESNLNELIKLSPNTKGYQKEIIKIQ